MNSFVGLRCEAISMNPTMLKDRGSLGQCMRAGVDRVNGYKLCRIHSKQAERGRTPVQLFDGKMIIPPRKYPPFYYQRLFNHMADNHGLTLTESEMHEIALVCASLSNAAAHLRAAKGETT